MEALDYTKLTPAMFDSEFGALIYDLIAKNSNYKPAEAFDQHCLEMQLIGKHSLEIIVDLDPAHPRQAKNIQKYTIDINRDFDFDPADYTS